MKLYIVRHGNIPSQPALAELHDPPLSELGHKQAQALAQRLKDVCFDRIYTSPLQRCVATAGYVNAIQGTQAQIVNAMLEKGTKANDCGLPFSCLLHLCGFLCENRLTEYACVQKPSFDMCAMNTRMKVRSCSLPTVRSITS